MRGNSPARFEDRGKDETHLCVGVLPIVIKWLTGSLDYIIPNYDSNGEYLGSWTTNTYLADDRTVAAIQYFAGTDTLPLEALGNHQSIIKKARLAKKHKKITDRIDEKMELVPAMPRDFNYG